MRGVGALPLLIVALCLGATSSSADCPQGYTAGLKSGLCLYADKGPKTFADAEAFCEGAGGHLATIFSQDTLSDVLDACTSATGGNDTCFVGAQLLRETRYNDYNTCSIGQAPSNWVGSQWIWQDACVGFMVDLWSWYSANTTQVSASLGDCVVTKSSDEEKGLYPSSCNSTAGFVCALPGGCPTSSPLSPALANMDAEVAALQDIKAAIVCDPFELLDSWVGDYACSYRGVYCLSTGEVVGLVLEDFALQGTLAPGIGELAQLGFLHIPGNLFTGTLPSEINQLKLLAEIDMSDNEFCGGFPNITGLTGLVYLDMRFNKFSGPIPDWVYSLPLDVLVLNNNNFTGPLSYAVGELKMASLMILAHNNLKSVIPESIGKLESMAQMLLHNNSLGNNETLDLTAINSDTFSESGPALPYSITNLSTLLSLDVSMNKLAGDLPPTLHRMQGLVEIALSNNVITGEIPPNITSLMNLTSLDLSYNALQGDVAPAFKIPSLERLIVKGNYLYLNGTIPKNNISIVDISGNCIFKDSVSGQKPPSTCAAFYGQIVYEYWRQPKNADDVILRMYAVRPLTTVRFVFQDGNHTVRGTGSSADMFHGHGTNEDVRGEGYVFKRTFRGESIYGYTCSVHRNHYGSIRILEVGALENKTFTFSDRSKICQEANPCSYIGDDAAQCISQPGNEDFPFVCKCSANWTFIGYSCYPGKRRANPYPSSGRAVGPRGGNNSGGGSSPSTSSPATEKPVLPPPPLDTTTPIVIAATNGDGNACSSSGEYYRSCKQNGDTRAKCRVGVCNELFTCLCSPGFVLVKDIRPDGNKVSTCKPSPGGRK